MSEYPGNSRREREEKRPQPPEKYTKPTGRKPEKSEEPAKPRVQQIVTDPDKVKRRKKPLSRRISENLFGSDAQSVGSFIMMDVLVPAMKDTVTSMVSEGIERLVYGDNARGGRRPVGSTHRSGHVAYNRMSESSLTRRRDPRDEERVSMSRRGRANHDFEEVVLDSRVEAEEVLSTLYEILNKYDQVAVADLYSMLGISGTYMDEKWGWEDLRGAQVVRRRGFYLLDLPAPEPLA